jgi:biopolymer transport protein ExbB
MHIVERAKLLMMSAGSEWVMWLLIGLSIASVAVIIERVLALRALRTDLSALRRDLVQGLQRGGFLEARALLTGRRHPAALVALRGVEGNERETTAKQAEEAMAAESVAQRRALERRFSFLATLGANAPFIGLFGTVVGILQAFDALGHGGLGGPGAIAPQAIMSSISEALVATAIGLGVAIPAVFAYNLLERTVKAALDDAQMLSFEILSYLESPAARTTLVSARDATREPSSVREPSSRSGLSQTLRSSAATLS